MIDKKIIKKGNFLNSSAPIKKLNTGTDMQFKPVISQNHSRVAEMLALEGIIAEQVTEAEDENVPETDRNIKSNLEAFSAVTGIEIKTKQIQLGIHKASQGARPGVGEPRVQISTMEMRPDVEVKQIEAMNYFQDEHGNIMELEEVDSQ